MENGINESHEPRMATNLKLVPTPRLDLKTLENIRVEMAKVYRAVKKGEIQTQEGTRLVYMLAQIGKIIEVAEIETRLKVLEAAQERRLLR